MGNQKGIRAWIPVRSPVRWRPRSCNRIPPCDVPQLFCSSISWKTEGLSDRRLKGVLTFIEEHLAEDLSLKQIAAVAGISPSHLKAVFSKTLGTPLHQYVIQRRIEAAKGLLVGTDLSITEIALATGFAHQSHLARHMRRILGEAPSAIRQALGGKRRIFAS